MINKRKYYNDHYIYIRTGVAHEYQLRTSLEQAIKLFNQPCEYQINFIQKNKLYAGFSYIWVSNFKFGYALTSRSINGIKIDVPLITLSPYTYDDIQLEHLRSMIPIDQEDIPTQGYFEIDRAWVKDGPYHTKSYELVSSYLPEWITVKYLSDKISKYATVKMITKNNHMVITFPQINIIDCMVYDSDGICNRVQICNIKFSSDTHDGKFFSLMCRKLMVTNPNNDNDNYNIYFRYFDTTVKTKSSKSTIL